MKIIILDQNNNPVIAHSFKNAGELLQIDGRSVKGRLMRVIDQEDFIKYRLCKRDQYVEWYGEMKFKKTEQRYENGNLFTYCADGCAQLIEYCMCEEYDKAIQIISKTN